MERTAYAMRGECDAPWDRWTGVCAPGLAREARGGLESKVTRNSDRVDADGRQLRDKLGLRYGKVGWVGARRGKAWQGRPCRHRRRGGTGRSNAYLWLDRKSSVTAQSASGGSVVVRENKTKAKRPVFSGNAPSHANAKKSKASAKVNTERSNARSVLTSFHVAEQLTSGVWDWVLRLGWRERLRSSQGRCVGRGRDRTWQGDCGCIVAFGRINRSRNKQRWARGDVEQQKAIRCQF